MVGVVPWKSHVLGSSAPLRFLATHDGLLVSDAEDEEEDAKEDDEPDDAEPDDDGTFGDAGLESVNEKCATYSMMRFELQRTIAPGTGTPSMCNCPCRIEPRCSDLHAYARPLMCAGDLPMRWMVKPVP